MTAGRVLWFIGCTTIAYRSGSVSFAGFVILIYWLGDYLLELTQ